MSYHLLLIATLHHASTEVFVLATQHKRTMYLKNVQKVNQAMNYKDLCLAVSKLKCAALCKVKGLATQQKHSEIQKCHPDI